MKKTICRWMFVVWSCMIVLPLFAGNTEFWPKPKKECEAVNITYTDNLGGGDEAGVAYKNVFARFVEAQDDAPGFWFYVYQKGNIWLCEGADKNRYDRFPQYIAVRVYDGNQKERINSQYTTAKTGVFMATNSGVCEPFYFTTEDGQNHAVMNCSESNTVILSAPMGAFTLSSFYVAPLRQAACGEETEEFTQLLNSFTLK